MDDIIDFAKLCSCLLLVIAAFAAPVALFSLSVAKYECAEFGKMNNTDTKTVAGNCYIKEGSRWYRWDEYKLRNATTGTSK